MATINVSNLTLNAQETQEFSKMIVEHTFAAPELSSLNNVIPGIKMKEQITFASQFGKMGVKADGACGRVTSNGSTILTQKFWDPANIEETIEICQADVSGLFKSYYSKIQNYKQRYEIEGSDEAVFLSLMTENAIKSTIDRAVWLADKDVAVATSGVSGLAVASSGETVHYDYFDGIWAQVFDAVGTGSTDVQRYTIVENTGTTATAQGLAAGRGKTILEGVLKNADSRLRGDAEKQFYVSRSVFDSYVDSLIAAGENSTIEYTLNGLQTVKYKGIPVVNMETIWDANLVDFVNNTVNNAPYLSNRAILSTPSNLPVGTLDEADFAEIETWYDQTTKKNYLAFAFNLDSKMLENYMISVAY